MIYNHGESTGSFVERHENEFTILTESTSHNNIIKIFTYFIDKPTKEMISELPNSNNKFREPNFESDDSRIRSSLIVVFEYIPNNLGNYLKKMIITLFRFQDYSQYAKELVKD